MARNKKTYEQLFMWSLTGFHIELHLRLIKVTVCLAVWHKYDKFDCIIWQIDNDNVAVCNFIYFIWIRGDVSLTHKIWRRFPQEWMDFWLTRLHKHTKVKRRKGGHLSGLRLDSPVFNKQIVVAQMSFGYPVQTISIGQLRDFNNTRRQKTTGAYSSPLPVVCMMHL